MGFSNVKPRTNNAIKFLGFVDAEWLAPGRAAPAHPQQLLLPLSWMARIRFTDPLREIREKSLQTRGGKRHGRYLVCLVSCIIRCVLRLGSLSQKYVPKHLYDSV